MKGVKQMFKKFLSLILVLSLTMTVFLFSPAAVSAEEAPDFAELVALGKDAETFAMMLKQSFHPTACDIVYKKMSQDEVIKRTRELVFRKGYVDEHIAETVCPLEDPNGNGFDIIQYYPFSERMASLEIWNKEVRKYFVSDFLGLVNSSGDVPVIVEYNGKTYGMNTVDTFFYADWDECVLTDYSQQHAEITVLVVSAEDGNGLGYATVDFSKETNGWRVSGGSFYEYVYEHTGSLIATPPKTGEHTALYALIFTLAVLPLAGIGVYRWRKRRVI
jgi:hypothetical protein